MKHSLKTGLSFGLTSGIITTLGLMVGLNAGTHSKLAVVGGILTIAVADAFSDALGIHISEESENKHTTQEIWEATLATFLAKFLFASIFIFPVLILELSAAILISVILGLFLLGFFSFLVARKNGVDPRKVVVEHLVVVSLVIILTQLLGAWIASRFS